MPQAIQAQQTASRTQEANSGNSSSLHFTTPENTLSATVPTSAPSTQARTSTPSKLKHWIDDFETLNPTWQEIDGDCTYRLVKRVREKGAAMTGQGYEHLQIECDSAGSKIYVAYPLAPVQVRQELLIQLAVQANRSGIQLMAQVVLPFARDPKTQKAMTFYVNGGTYSSVNRWQKLRIENIQQQVQVEIAKRQMGLQQPNTINFQYAYIDNIVLNTYSGTGMVDLQIDSLELSGVYPVDSTVLAKSKRPVTSLNQGANQSSAPKNIEYFPPVEPESFPLVPKDTVPQPNQKTQNGNNSANSQTFVPKKFNIHLNQGVVMVDDTPIFVRAIRYHGEKLEYLSSLGFNTVWLEEPPTKMMEAEAALQKMWFICPPPVDLWKFQGDPTQAVSEEKRNSRHFNRVLAWDLGRTPTTDDIPPAGSSKAFNPRTQKDIETTLEIAQLQTNLMKQIPETILPSRPNLVIPDKDLAPFSSFYDIMMLERNPLNSTTGIVSYGLWFRSMQNLLRSKQSVFAKVPTQYDPFLRAQWYQLATNINGVPADSNISPDNPNFVPSTLPLEQLRLLTYNVVVAGSRGILYESSSRLDAQDDETRYRARSLELVNLEMLILEQWLSEGNKFTTIPSNHADIAGAVLEAKHVRILLPMLLEPNSQYVCGAGAERKVKFLVRGLPSTYQCWLYSLNGLSPLANHRIAGGVEVELDELPLIATIVMTQNSLIINSISHRVTHYAPRIANIMKELAEIRLRSYLQFYGAKPLPKMDSIWYEKAKAYLENADKAIYTHEYSDAFMLAQRAMRPIMLLEKMLWQEQTMRFPSPNFQPTSVSFRSLRLQERWIHALQGLGLGENLMPNGDFENSNAVISSGWNFKIKKNPFHGVIYDNKFFYPEAAYTGNLGIKLYVDSKEKQDAPVMLDSPPILIESPPVFVGPPGTIYQVELWLKIPTRIQNSIDGAKIVDTNAGEVLAERILETDGWKKISFQRIVRDNHPIRIQISMTGYGTAYIDDVKIYPLKPSF